MGKLVADLMDQMKRRLPQATSMAEDEGIEGSQVCPIRQAGNFGIF